MKNHESKVDVERNGPEMNSEDDMDYFDTHIDPFINQKGSVGQYKTNRKWSADHHVIGHFRKKTIIFRDTRDHQEHDAKNRLSVPGPSFEEPVAEIHQLKNNRP